MVILKLVGGLGNQMFQYAMGKALECRNKISVIYDKNSFAEDDLRSYSLGCFDLDCKFADEKDVKRLLGENYFYKKIRKLRDRFSPLFKKTLIEEPFFHFDPQLLNIGLNGKVSYVSGFWQSEKYFADYSDAICRDFQFKIEMKPILSDLAKKIQATNSINLHIRRGDYINNTITNEFHGTCSLDYYQMAIRNIYEEVNDPHIFVFSDDIAWCKQNLNFDLQIFFVERPGDSRDYVDMWLMSLCKHHVIANSSFSWWGAWLANNPQKIIYAPKDWFRKKSDNLNTKDLLPKTWRII